MLPTSVLLVIAVLRAGVVVSGQKWKTEFGPCFRDCTEDPEPRLCHFTFTEEIYATLTAACKNCSSGVEADCYAEQCAATDGVERTIYTINRQLPGPGIHVCEGDVIQVDLVVKLPGHGETIHWHGLPQMETPYFDGVAGVTQCPVHSGSVFRYEFAATSAGTMFYHSHSGLHKVNGITGALIIRQSRAVDPQSHLYDEDLPQHVIIYYDWFHVDVEFVMPGLMSRITGQPSDVVLVNAQGRYRDPATNRTTLTPLATFNVQAGTRYRFRLINAGSLSCPIQVQFEEHEMNVIAADSTDIKPQRANSLYTFSGERWDVVIQTKWQPTRRAYWIYFRTVGFCQDRGTSEQVALLIYDDATGVNAVPTVPAPSFRANRTLPAGTVVNTIAGCESEEQVCSTELSVLQPLEGLWTAPNSRASELVFLRIKFAVRPNDKFFAKNKYNKFLAFGPATLTGVINDIAFTDPSSPFLTQAGESPWCNEDNLPDSCDGEEVCECSHLIHVPYGVTVDLLMVDETDLDPGDDSTTTLSHPMHIHGMPFACMGMGTLRNVTNGKERARVVKEMYARNTLPTGVRHPALKDVLLLPGGGWILVRFLATNPGVWFFHCHFQYHMASGMEAAFQVGDSNMFVQPPPGFPKCGNFLHSEYYVPGFK